MLTPRKTVRQLRRKAEQHRVRTVFRRQPFRKRRKRRSDAILAEIGI